jgi:hypothetical protein
MSFLIWIEITVPFDKLRKRLIEFVEMSKNIEVLTFMLFHINLIIHSIYMPVSQ